MKIKLFAFSLIFIFTATAFSQVESVKITPRRVVRRRANTSADYKKTGKQLRPADVFTNLGGLAAKVKKAQQAEMKNATEEYKKDPDAADFDASEYFREADFTVKNLNEFTVGDRGVTFIYDYGFPHVALALQPEGRFFYSWAELKPFVRRDGLFGRFVR